MLKFKKLITIGIALCLTMTTCIPSFASTSKDITDAKNELKLNRNTVITLENFDQVLMNYGIDPSNVMKRDNSTGSSATMTVGEFEDALNNLKKQPKKISINNVEKVEENKPFTPEGMVYPAEYFIAHGNVSLSNTTMMASDWGMVRSCTAEWIYYSETGVKEYVQANSEYASIYNRDISIGTKYSIDSVNYLYSTCTPSLVTVYSDVMVGGYISIGFDPFSFDIRISTCQVTGYSTFNTSHIEIS